MFHPFADGFIHKIGGLEIHVGDPEGEDILCAEHHLKIGVFFCPGAVAINNFVKIVHKYKSRKYL